MQETKYMHKELGYSAPLKSRLCFTQSRLGYRSALSFRRLRRLAMKAGEKCGIALIFLSALPSWSQPVQGGLPGKADQSELRLSLSQAIDIALSTKGNIQVQIANEDIALARTRSAQSRASLLPNVDGSVNLQSKTVNLKSFGINFQTPLPGVDFPRLVGPFNVFDARATARQTVFNLSAIKNYQASRSAVRQVEAETENIIDQVKAQVSRVYLFALFAKASVEASVSNVALSEALLQLSVNQKSAGTGTGIEVTRAQVQLANDRQQLLVAQNQSRSAQLQLLKVIGLDLDLPLELTEVLSYIRKASLSPAQALKVALESRADWKAQQRRVETAELRAAASRMERMPSLSLFADYGSLGNSINDSVPTRSYGFSVQIPLFDGGRRDAKSAESAILLRQEHIRGQDLLAQIELEIRVALDSLQSANQQVGAAEEGLLLANNELAQAQRRYRAGVTTNLEVTDAQMRVARARENRNAALYNYNLARIDLLMGMGSISDITK